MNYIDILKHYYTGVDIVKLKSGNWNFWLLSTKRVNCSRTIKRER
jgi:hypothetical protein